MKCSFCGKTIKKGTGVMLLKNDGKIMAYCSKKCERNAKIRKPLKVKWVTKKKKE